MKKKSCIKCGVEKFLDEYYAHKAMADGHLGKCKVCCKIDNKANRDAKLDHYREYDRRRGNRQDKAYRDDWKKRNPDKYLAHNAVNNALRDGRLKKGVCECGETRVVAHHEDYSKPLDVIWMCQACHCRHHQEND